MNKANLNAAILSITLDKNTDTSLQSQLLVKLRSLVHGKKLLSGDRLPASRILAKELSVSRITITSVYDQLVAEGYLQGRRGSGVFVATDLPDFPVHIETTKKPLSRKPVPATAIKAFEIASPDLRLFPFQEWARLLDQTWRNPDRELIGLHDPLGWLPLRQAIANHLDAWRGLTCNPGQIVITSGLVESVDLISSSLFKDQDEVLVEEPGHQVLINALDRNSLNVTPVRVDEQGFDLSQASGNGFTAKGVFVTPSRQFPLGMTLTLSRRLQLLSWASQTDGYIIEDDFDGEYRYQGQPLPAIMSLDQQERVIYVGSFSKVLFPALRLSFVVLPEHLVETIKARLDVVGSRASIIAQPALARFIDEGGFATHLRRTRRIYLERQKYLLELLNDQLSDYLCVEPQAGGMHLVAPLNPDNKLIQSDMKFAQQIEERAIIAPSLSSYFTGRADMQGLVLGYAGFDQAEIEAGVSVISKVMKQ